jgi:hypothetical protein
MSRFLLALTAVVALAAAAVADLGPRPLGPIPKSKSVPVTNVLKYANEFPNHTFWAITDGPNGPTVVPMKADPSKPHPLNLKGVTSAVIYALPNDVAKQYETPREFLRAVASARIPLTVVASPVLVKEEAVFAGDKRTAIERVTVVSGGIKTGVAFAEEDPVPARKDPLLPKKKNDPEPDAPDEATAEDRPAPRLIVVGLASALAVAFAGLWVVRRK